VTARSQRARIDVLEADPNYALMPVGMVIGVLQDASDVSRAGVSNPGAFSADFIERQVLPHLYRLAQMERNRA
jgi:hypothetical protein